ncbi:MAG: hypothetical protein ABIL74_05910 [candidate division WOR-3 bacterium]
MADTKLKLFTLWQMDVKYLRYMAKGVTFFVYAEEFLLINAMRFI